MAYSSNKPVHNIVAISRMIVVYFKALLFNLVATLFNQTREIIPPMYTINSLSMNVEIPNDKIKNAIGDIYL